MLGDVASSHSLAAAPICQAEKIPMISPVLDEPARDAGRQLHLPRLLHRPVPGRRDGEVRRRHAQGEARSRSSSTSAATTPSASRPSSGQAFKKLGGEVVAEQSYSQGDSDFRAQLTADQGRQPRGHLRPGLLHRGRHDRAPGPRARHHGAAPRAATAGTRPKLWEIGGDGAERLLLLQPLLDRRPEPGRPEVRDRLQERKYNHAAGRAGGPRLRRGARSWRTR